MGQIIPEIHRHVALHSVGGATHISLMMCDQCLQALLVCSLHGWIGDPTPHVDRPTVLFLRFPNPKLSENLKFLLTSFMAELDLNGYVGLFLCFTAEILMFLFTGYYPQPHRRYYSTLAIPNFQTLKLSESQNTPGHKVLNRGLWNCIYLKILTVGITRQRECSLFLFPSL